MRGDEPPRARKPRGPAPSFTAGSAAATLVHCVPWASGHCQSSPTFVAAQPASASTAQTAISGARRRRIVFVRSVIGIRPPWGIGVGPAVEPGALEEHHGDRRAGLELDHRLVLLGRRMR